MPEFAGGVSYTPFFSQAMGSMAGAITDRRAQQQKDEQNELASAAWMGDPQALQDLAAVNPQMAGQVEQQVISRKREDRQESMARDTAFSDDLKRVLEQISSFPDYESAREFGQQMTNVMGEKYPERWAQAGIPPEFDQASFDQIKTIAGADLRKGMKVVGAPYQVKHPETGKPATAAVLQDEKGNAYEQLIEGPEGGSLTRLSQYDATLKREIAEAAAEGKELGQTTEQRAQVLIDAGTVAAMQIPEVNRALDLLDVVETSGLEEDILRLQQYVGYEGEETADLSELQQLLATQMFDTLANFRGSISEGELKTAKQLSTGLGKNTEANKRVLRRLQKKLARQVELARTAAEERGDTTALAMLADFNPYAAAASDSPPAGSQPEQRAPQAAIDYLKAHPENAEAFKAKFGYLP